MPSRLKKWLLCRIILVSVLGLASSSAIAQQPYYHPPYPPPGCLPPPGVAPPGVVPPRTGEGTVPPTGTTPPDNTGMGTNTNTNTNAADNASQAFGNLASGAGVGASAGLAAPGGYLDNPIPKTMILLRYDGMFGINRPDRAEYFYGAWQELAFHPHAIRGQDGSFKGTFQDPKARGPQQFPGELNVEEATVAMEYAYKSLNNRVSTFLEVPVRFMNFRDLLEDPDKETPQLFPEPDRGGPENHVGNDPSGLSDIRFGFKAALVADPDRYLTFQGRFYSPTGNASRGLGTGHWSLEPSLLYYQRLSDCIELQGQFTDWIPVAAGPEAGNVLEYGVGLGYTVYRQCDFRIVPMVELVGWTVLSGLESFALPSGQLGAVTVPAGITVPTSHGVQEAAGDTIVNVKLGVRTYFSQGQDLYVGYGRSLTGDRWYQDTVRVEYRWSF